MLERMSSIASMKAAGSIGLVHRDKLFEPLAR